MRVSFRTAKLRECYQDVGRAVTTWGEPAGKKYIQRINTLMVAANLAELSTVRSLKLHPLHGDLAGKHALALHGRLRLIIVYDEKAKAVVVEEVSKHYED